MTKKNSRESHRTKPAKKLPAKVAIAPSPDKPFPEYDGKSVNYKKLTDKRLPLTRLPLSVTIMKIGDYLFVDPSIEEEKVIDSRLTVAITDGGKICAMQKGGDAPVTIDDVDRMIELATAKAAELAGKLKR